MAVLAATFLAPLVPVPVSLASGTAYQSGNDGYDLSFPQCGTTVPSSSDRTTYAFGIVGVTGGKAFTTNSCWSSEYSAVTSEGLGASFYMNLNSPLATTSSNGQTGPAGTCAKSDKSCSNYNYGWNAAAAAYATVKGSAGTSVADGSPWWLDVETANLWSGNKTLDNLVIQGAIDFFHREVTYPGAQPASSTQYIDAATTVGIYSDASSWSRIAGGQSYAGIPAWVTGASSLGSAPSLCTTPSFDGGPVWLVQHPQSTYDQDYACAAAA
jgi:hypothetical protein